MILACPSIWKICLFLNEWLDIPRQWHSQSESGTQVQEPVDDTSLSSSITLYICAVVCYTLLKSNRSKLLAQLADMDPIADKNINITSNIYFIFLGHLWSNGIFFNLEIRKAVLPSNSRKYRRKRLRFIYFSLYIYYFSEIEFCIFSSNTQS